MSYEQPIERAYLSVRDDLKNLKFDRVIDTVESVLPELMGSSDLLARFYFAQAYSYTKKELHFKALTKYMIAYESALIKSSDDLIAQVQYYLASTSNTVESYALTIELTTAIPKGASPSQTADIRILRAQAYASTGNHLMTKDILKDYFPTEGKPQMNTMLMLWLLANAYYYLEEYDNAVMVVNELAARYQGPAVDYLTDAIQEAVRKRQKLREWG